MLDRLAARGPSPLMDALGVRVSLEDGRPVIRMTVDDRHLRSHGIAHGGFLCTVLDTALGAAAYETLEDEGVELVTAQLNVNFIRPVWSGEEILASAEVVHAGRQTMVVRGQIALAKDESPVMSGSGTFMRVQIAAKPA